MKKILWLFCIMFAFADVLAQPLNQNTLFTRADSLRGSLSPLRTCYDLNYHHLDVRVDIEEQQISGSNLFRFTATQDFKKLQFDLFDNYLIEKIEYNGQELDYSTELDAVFIEFPSTIKKGSKQEFKVYYSGSPMIAKNAPWDGGFVFTKDANGKPWVAVACQGLGASSWWPTKDHQADEVDSMMISISVPDSLMNVSNGRLRSVEDAGQGYKKYNWFVSYPINNYNVTLNIGDYVHFSDKYQGERGLLSLDYYVLRENLQKAQTHFSADVKPMLKCFEYWFGPYPFYRDGYKLVEAPYLGMEHQSAIAYGNKYQKGYLGSDWSRTGLGLKWDYLIIHESGHEWFGNNITSKDAADMWIHEAFTTYSEGLFVECQEGKEAGVRYIKGERSAVRNDAPMIGIYGVNKEGSGDMYFKGANMLHTVRSIINDDSKWRKILRSLNSQLGLRTTDTREVVALINTLSGKNLTKVFDQYLRYRSIPTLELRTIAGGLSFRWKADVKGFDMPVRIKFNEQAKWITVQPGPEWKHINLQGNASSVRVDTDNFYINTAISK
ncbi:M1 family metallopeptidase [Pedobacter sp. SYSU D00535]|uniref:M1 family metallopeptidase n=1 Tax=Pedobacter sp. SYSU D00535 TaxID=2810308 RepID=UPI001A95C1F2|nr:M1 family metallopeptidase [Pedobacter sp. SYSU D00535]